MRSTAWLASAAGALAIGACGGGGDRTPTANPGTAEQRSSPTPSPRAAAPEARADAADIRVVRAWADSLRRGDVRRAARFFALPSLVANGTPPIRLETRAQVLLFNRTLSCGAVVIGTEPAAHGFLITTFRLTERPGTGTCGSGTGETARAAFRVRDRRITDWLRLESVASEPKSVS